MVSADGAAQSSVHVRITARRSWFGFGFRELWQYRELVRVLALRDVKLRYRQTALGVGGVILGPLLTAGVMSFVFGEVAGLHSEGVPYFAFSYAGFLGWNIFAALIGRTSSVLLSNAALVNKTYVPRLVLPISGVLVAIVDFAIGSILMGLVMIVWRLNPGIAVLTAPLWIFAIAALGLGIGTAFSAAMVHYRDVGLATSVVLQVLLYVTPVAYSASEIPERFRLLYHINPMTSLVEGLRWSLVGTHAPSATAAVVSVVSCAVVLIAGFAVFNRLERSFADVI